MYVCICMKQTFRFQTKNSETRVKIESIKDKEDSLTSKHVDIKYELAGYRISYSLAIYEITAFCWIHRWYKDEKMDSAHKEFYRNDDSEFTVLESLVKSLFASNTRKNLQEVENHIQAIRDYFWDNIMKPKQEEEMKQMEREAELRKEVA